MPPKSPASARFWTRRGCRRTRRRAVRSHGKARLRPCPRRHERRDRSRERRRRADGGGGSGHARRLLRGIFPESNGHAGSNAAAVTVGHVSPPGPGSGRAVSASTAAGCSTTRNGGNPGGAGNILTCIGYACVQVVPDGPLDPVIEEQASRWVSGSSASFGATGLLLTTSNRTRRLENRCSTLVGVANGRVEFLCLTRSTTRFNAPERFDSKSANGS